MGGFFGVVSTQDCVQDLYYGTDYHSHLGTRRGGLAVQGTEGITRYIHNIENAQFRSKFSEDIGKLSGKSGIGVISDFEAQPLLIGSHLGTYAIATVGHISNMEHLVQQALSNHRSHFTEMSRNVVNPTELVATLINQQDTLEAGIEKVQEIIEGSCSLLILTENAIYAGRDKMGRTPISIAKKETGFAVTFESCAFPNLGYHFLRNLGPGEIVRITTEGVDVLRPSRNKMNICSFLWIYYGYPSSSYEGINVEWVRNRCGEALAKNDTTEIDYVAGIPDSGVAHALGYANRSGKPYQRGFVKYTPTWPRSFMPQKQQTRDLIAVMKLLPIQKIIQGKRALLCEDSIVRGTQLKDTIQRLYDCGAKEVHMRVACPPLLHTCKYLNFSQSRSELDLAARQAILALQGSPSESLDPYKQPGSTEFGAMVNQIRQRLRLTSLKYQTMEDMVASISLPKEQLCTYCWDGKE
jgi:amidophosphoribosyltransferase